MFKYEYQSNQVEHKDYVDRINADPKYCDVCGIALPGDLYRYNKGLCSQCAFDKLDIASGFITREEVEKRIAENKALYPYFYTRLQYIQQSLFE